MVLAAVTKASLFKAPDMAFAPFSPVFKEKMMGILTEKAQKYDDPVNFAGSLNGTLTSAYYREMIKEINRLEQINEDLATNLLNMVANKNTQK